jgi:hypothetical protein
MLSGVRSRGGKCDEVFSVDHTVSESDVIIGDWIVGVCETPCVGLDKGTDVVRWWYMSSATISVVGWPRLARL